MNKRLDAFFSYGFRPFFLGAGLYGVVGMAAWITWIGLHAAGGEVKGMDGGFPPYLWHAHEMLFGYVGAAVAGFLLTATPGWSGRKPVSGAPLAALFAAWLAGRVAVWLAAFLPAALVAIVDLAFWVFLFAVVLRTLAGGKARNFVFLALLALLVTADVMVHLERLGLAAGTAAAGHRLALDSVVLLIAIVGGRVVPAFTRNALRAETGEADPIPALPRLDAAGIGAVAALLVADQATPGAAAAGWLALFAAAANGARLVRWRGWQVLDQPILWIVHLGFAWMVTGLGLKAWALLGGGMIEATALHALTVGAIGSMTLGIMTRAGLGHTGRPLKVAPEIAAAYLLLSLAALIRVVGPFALPQFYNAVLLAAGVSWCVVFAIFSWVYSPILTTPRLGGGS